MDAKWNEIYNQVSNVQYDVQSILRYGGVKYNIKEPYDDYLELDKMTISELKETLIILQDIFTKCIQEYNNFELYSSYFSEFVNDIERKRRTEEYKKKLKEKNKNNKNILNLCFNHPIKELVWCCK